MRLNEYVTGLKAHEASVALGLLELVRHADAEGALERGLWLAAIRAAYVAHISEQHEGGGLLDAAADVDSLDEPGAYLDDHVLARLSADGVAHGEPAGEGWERVRLAPGFRDEVAHDRDAAVERLDETVRNLLQAYDRGSSTFVRPEPVLVEDGSTLTARGLVKSIASGVWWRTWTSRSRRARSSGCSVRTAPARRPRST
jgi:hypothetical protein